MRMSPSSMAAIRSSDTGPSISRGGSLATADLLCGLPGLPLLWLHTPGEEQRSDERQGEDEEPGRLGGWVPVVEQAHEQENQNPEDDVPGDSPFREIKDPAHRPPPSQAENKKPSVPVATLRLFQRYIAPRCVCRPIAHVRRDRVRRHLGDVRPDASRDPRGKPRPDAGFQLLR